MKQCGGLARTSWLNRGSILRRYSVSHRLTEFALIEFGGRHVKDVRKQLVGTYSGGEVVCDREGDELVDLVGLG